MKPVKTCLVNKATQCNAGPAQGDDDGNRPDNVSTGGHIWTVPVVSDAAGRSGMSRGTDAPPHLKSSSKGDGVSSATVAQAQQDTQAKTSRGYFEKSRRSRVQDYRSRTRKRSRSTAFAAVKTHCHLVPRLPAPKEVSCRSCASVARAACAQSKCHTRQSPLLAVATRHEIASWITCMPQQRNGQVFSAGDGACAAQPFQEGCPRWQVCKAAGPDRGFALCGAFERRPLRAGP
jgi:hypothetical protein